MDPYLMQVLFKDATFRNLVAVGRTCKSFYAASTRSINERIKTFSRKTFDEITQILQNPKNIQKIGQIKNTDLKELVALVQISPSYVLWDKQLFCDVHDVENNIKALKDFLNCRFYYASRLNTFAHDPSLKMELVNRMRIRAMEVHHLLGISDSSWTKKNYIDSIPKILKTEVDIDQFYYALYQMFILKQSWAAEKTLAALCLKGHRLSQWSLGEHYLNSSKTRDAINYLQDAASDGDLFFEYRFAILMFDYDKTTYMNTIIRITYKCMHANFPQGFYLAGLLAKARFIKTGEDSDLQARVYFEQGAALGCKEAQEELDKMIKAEKPSSSCLVS